MADEEESAEKPFEATPRKLEEARKRGEVPVSQDLVTFGVYLAILAAALFAGTWSLNEGGLSLLPYLATPETLADTIFAENGRIAHGPMIAQFVAQAKLHHASQPNTLLSLTNPTPPVHHQSDRVLSLLEKIL